MGSDEDYEKEWKRIRDGVYLDEWVEKVWNIPSSKTQRLSGELMSNETVSLCEDFKPRPLKTSEILKMEKSYMDLVKGNVCTRELYALQNHSDDIFDMLVEGRWEKLIQMAEKIESEGQQ